MSHGKINKDQQNDELTLDRLNNFLARLLGKRNKSPQEIKHPTSDGKFVLIIIAMVLFLWGLTGVYYIPEHNYGLILHNGKLDHIRTGFAIGIDFPYPFSDVVTLDNNTVNISIGKLDSTNTYTVISSDGKELQLSAEISYHISDPRQYFIFHYQENSNSEQVVKWLVQTSIQNYMLGESSNEVLHASTIVIANDIRKLSSNSMNSYGLTIDKLAITGLSNKSLQQTVATEDISGKTGNLAAQIIDEANRYKINKTQETKTVVANFNQLLPQFLDNPQAISQLIYYKMLSSIPAPESAIPKYLLLNLSLEQLKAKIDGGGLKTVSDKEESDLRVLNRSVDRERIFKGR